MVRSFVLTIIICLAASTFGSAHAQTGIPVAGSSGAPSPGSNSSTRAIDPALDLRGMPCSVSLNATGGVTTSSSCGSDPLEVPARTIVSPAQVNGTQAPSAQTSGGALGSPSAGGTTGGSAVSGTRSATPAASASSGAGPSPSALCSTTGGPTGAASLIGGC